MIQVFWYRGGSCHSMAGRRVIGLVYRIPLTAIIGGSPEMIITVVRMRFSSLLVADLILPVCRWLFPRWFLHIFIQTVSGKMPTGAFRGRHAVCGYYRYDCLCGLFSARKLTRLFQTPLGVYALQVLAPTLIIVAVSGVYPWIFPGNGNDDS